MKAKLLSIFLSLLICNTFAQVISQKTTNVINSIRLVNELRFDDVNERGLKPSQYFNYQKLQSNASSDELLYFANDTNEIVKAYTYLALLERQNDEIKNLYIRSVQDKEKVENVTDGIISEIYLYDYLRYKIYNIVNADNYKSFLDTFYNKMNSDFDSILIMNYNWNESDVFMDDLIESESLNKEALTKRKRWLANSYFKHKIAKKNDDYLFGRLCGYPATMPYLRSIVEKSLQDTLLDRVDYFDKWVSCDILVVKVYGAEALIRLQNEGEILTPYQTKLIKQLKNSFKSIQMCMNYYRERKPVRFALKDYELKEFATN